MRISDWSSDVCSSDLPDRRGPARIARGWLDPLARPRRAQAQADDRQGHPARSRDGAAGSIVVVVGRDGCYARAMIEGAVITRFLAHGGALMTRLLASDGAGA